MNAIFKKFIGCFALGLIGVFAVGCSSINKSDTEPLVADSQAVEAVAVSDQVSPLDNVDLSEYLHDGVGSDAFREYGDSYYLRDSSSSGKPEGVGEKVNEAPAGTDVSLSSEGVLVYDLGTIYWFTDSQYDYLKTNLSEDLIERQNSFTVVIRNGSVSKDSSGACFVSMTPEEFAIFKTPIYDLRTVNTAELLTEECFEPETLISALRYEGEGRCDFGSYVIYS